jgi:hypothetical protein
LRHYHLKRKEKGSINRKQKTRNKYKNNINNTQVQRKANTNMENNQQNNENNNKKDIQQQNNTNNEENNNNKNNKKKMHNKGEYKTTTQVQEYTSTGENNTINNKKNNHDINQTNNTQQEKTKENNNNQEKHNNEESEEENNEEGNNHEDSSDEDNSVYDGREERNVNKMKDFYGNEIDKCGEDTLRFVGININNIPESSSSPKNKQLFQAINESEAGIVGITEVGRCWHLIPEKDRWTERVKGWWENSKSTISYNTKDVAPSKYQPGGTILCSIGRPCHRIIDSGVDKSGLGRWSWQRFRGRHDVTLRVISAYRPCRATGPNTVYSQQARYFDASSDTPIQPRKQFFEDLAKDILKWKNEEHDQIVLMMDANTTTSITSDRELQEFLNKTNLRDAITTTHQEDQGLQPTHHNGRHPIDGIFVSNTLHPIKCGYLPFGEFPSDHRAIN